MNNFDFESKKINIIIFVIFILFAMVIIKAFDYLPENADADRNADISKVMEQRNSKSVEQTQNSEEQPEAQEEQNNNQNGLNVDLSKDIAPKSVEKKQAEEPLEVIQENIQESPAPVQNTNAVSELDMKFINAQKYKEEKQYVKAIEEYKSILEQSSEPQVTARCYEEIANIYGVVKRYGTALSYAQRAYNTYPTSAREMLLARLYYKTGDLDKATKRMNNVLQRDFASDRE